MPASQDQKDAGLRSESKGEHDVANLKDLLLNFSNNLDQLQLAKFKLRRLDVMSQPLPTDGHSRKDLRLKELDKLQVRTMDFCNLVKKHPLIDSEQVPSSSPTASGSKRRVVPNHCSGPRNKKKPKTTHTAPQA